MRRLAVAGIITLTLLCAGCIARRVPAEEPCGPAPVVPYSEDMARSLDERLLPYLTGQAGAFTLSTTSQEVTSWIAYSAHRWPGIPVRDAVLWFSPERIHFRGMMTRVLPFSFTLQLHALVWLDGQAPQVTVEHACLGRFALPGWAKRFAERVINETIMDSGPYVLVDRLRLGNDEMQAGGWIGR